MFQENTVCCSQKPRGSYTVIACMSTSNVVFKSLQLSIIHCIQTELHSLQCLTLLYITAVCNTAQNSSYPRERQSSLLRFSHTWGVKYVKLSDTVLGFISITRYRSRICRPCDIVLPWDRTISCTKASLTCALLDGTDQTHNAEQR